MPKIYALLVGINDYQEPVNKLTGCLNDIAHFESYLTDLGRAPGVDLALEKLTDADATRDNVTRQFRGHLGRAAAGDVAVFHYCGHGARSLAATDFANLFRDGLDEGLVCYDSRPSGLDLADKELAVLTSEVANTGAHLAMILDCCHSGSATRSVDDFGGMRSRVTEVTDRTQPRPLESYIGGYYDHLKRKGDPLDLPTGRYISLAACDRTQEAKETADHNGVFTATMMEVLERSNGGLSYADLFTRCRAAVRKRARNQTPQFDTFGGFGAWSGFLGAAASEAGKRYRVYYRKHANDDGGDWQVECGAIHGASTDPDKAVTFQIYTQDTPPVAAGSAATTKVGAQRSNLEIHPTKDFALAQADDYDAVLTSMPGDPLVVDYEGPGGSRAALDAALRQDGTVMLSDGGDEARGDYVLTPEDGKLWLKQRSVDRRLQAVALDEAQPASVLALLPCLRTVARWERSLALSNKRTRFDKSQVDLVVEEQLPGGGVRERAGDEIVLEFAQVDGKWRPVEFKMRLRNHTGQPQPLHVALLYFVPEYGIRVLYNEPIASVGVDGPETSLTFEGRRAATETLKLGLDPGENEWTCALKLLISTEKVDSFLLTQDPLKLGETVESTRGGMVDDDSPKPLQNDWFTITRTIKVVRRMDQVSPSADCALADGGIVIESHPTVKANLSLGAAASTTRAADSASDFYRALAGQNIGLMNFANTRGESQNILQLTDIENAADLKAHPLRISVNARLAEGESILPIVFDGEHMLIGGDAWRDEGGVTRISIDHIPQQAADTRSVTSSLKLYFFKTFLKVDTVNTLRVASRDADGTIQFDAAGVADKVAASDNILLILHGLIGDTETIAAGVGPTGLLDRFGLVLTYDYENLHTELDKTAKELARQLADVGLGDGDGKRLTILAHGMGGLVARWFIEQEHGAATVDHLVMCGAPNHGSPFGHVESARNVLSVLTTLAMHFAPPLVPFGGGLLTVLNRSKEVTKTLEQISPGSEFMKTLNASADTGVAYTLLAGDIARYTEPGDRLFGKLLTKLGQGALTDTVFLHQPNDILASVESITHMGGLRKTETRRIDVACHHINYFTSDDGRRALGEVAW